MKFDKHHIRISFIGQVCAHMFYGTLAICKVNVDDLIKA